MRRSWLHKRQIRRRRREGQKAVVDVGDVVLRLVLGDIVLRVVLEDIILEDIILEDVVSILSFDDKFDSRHH